MPPLRLAGMPLTAQNSLRGLAWWQGHLMETGPSPAPRLSLPRLRARPSPAEGSLRHTTKGPPCSPGLLLTLWRNPDPAQKKGSLETRAGHLEGRSCAHSWEDSRLLHRRRVKSDAHQPDGFVAEVTAGFVAEVTAASKETSTFPS